jgi:hypothetical protein
LPQPLGRMNGDFFSPRQYTQMPSVTKDGLDTVKAGGHVSSQSTRRAPGERDLTIRPCSIASNVMS